MITAGQQVRAADHDRGQPDQPRRDPRAAALRQVEPRAPAGAGRPGRARARDPPRDAAAAGTGVRLDPDGRLERGGRRGSRAHATAPGASAAAPPPDPAALRRWPRAWPPRSPGAGRRPRHRRQRRLGGRGGAGREAAAAGVGHPGHRRRPDRLSREPSAIRRGAAAGHRPGLRDARRITTSSSSSAPRCSPTTPTSPARCWPRARALVALTSDPGEAARAPMGDAILGDVALALASARRAGAGVRAPAAHTPARARRPPRRPTR